MAPGTVKRTIMSESGRNHMMQRCTQLYDVLLKVRSSLCWRALTRVETQNFKDSKVGLNSNCSFRLERKAEGVAEGCDLEINSDSPLSEASGSLGEVNMLRLQTKALVVTPICGDNFRIIPPNCMVS